MREHRPRGQSRGSLTLGEVCRARPQEEAPSGDGEVKLPEKARPKPLDSRTTTSRADFAAFAGHSFSAIQEIRWTFDLSREKNS